ncbi:MAG: GDP-mannose 4,6-dehydratase [Candidatus Aenigmarchaeota archaeon]|nr:GDP-mannose 4,6-dehydratase [Candidatus Aenigmarchaeota archaeon]MBS3054169.1 GDP-mannose 4,6-dehydratase [Candidatus Aenigmarchaeota archaeon]
MANLVITGGGGFIGSHLTEELLQRGHEVTVFDNAELEKLRNIQHLKTNERFHFVKGDITGNGMKDVITEDIDVVYHLAAVVGVKNYCEDPLGTVSVNILGTKNVAEAAMKHGTKVIYTSTSEVFGKNPKVPWKEDDDRVVGSTKVDRWTYSTSKSMSEHMLFALNRMHGLPVTIVRYFNVYGPRQAPIFMIPACLRRILRNERPLIYDGGTPTRCFTYVKDAIEGTLLAAESKKAEGHAFNIGSMKERTLNETAQLMLKAAGREDLGVEYVDTRKLYGSIYEDIPRRVPDAGKAKAMLGWEATTSLEEGIREMIAWCRQNRWWFE